MNKAIAYNLLTGYMDGWKQNDIKLICSVLDDQCDITESHGPKYCGIKDIKLWFSKWWDAHSRVLKWELTSYYFCGDDNAAFIEWDFECISDGINYSLLGSSIIKFLNGKILSIQEYRMTKWPVEWNRQELISS